MGLIGLSLTEKNDHQFPPSLLYSLQSDREKNHCNAVSSVDQRPRGGFSLCPLLG